MLVYGVSGWCGPLQSDLAASWAEAIGTDAGVLVATGALVFVVKTWNSTRSQLKAAQDQLEAARAQLQIERKRDDRQEGRALREQADQLSGWLDRGKQGDREQREIYLVNSSGQPVYCVQVRLQAGENTWECKRLRSLPPIIPGEALRSMAQFDASTAKRLQQASDDNQPVGVCFTFRDIHGQDWTRRWDGELVPGYERFVRLPDEPSRDGATPSISGANGHSELAG
jgi:hypothetical protein